MSIVKDLLFLLPMIIMTYLSVFLWKKLRCEQETFIKFINHDIKISTLAQLRGVELLAGKNCSDLINDIKDSCSFTLEMIDALSCIYMLGNRKMVKCELNLNKLFISVFKELSFLADSKQMNFCYKVDNELSVMAERKNFYDLIKILISFALIFSDNKSDIYTFANATDSGLELTINYKGKMINDNMDYMAVGHGIKLMLCKKILDLYKGDLQIKNYENGNNALVLRFPRSIICNHFKPVFNSVLLPFFI